MSAKIPPDGDFLQALQQILVKHYAKHFASYKKRFGAQSGSSKWSTEGKDLVLQQFPFVKDEFVFHKRSKSAFDLYSPPHDMAIELAMFQGNAIYEFSKVLFKMLVAGPSYTKLVIVMPEKPGVKQLQSPFNRISFETFERTHHFAITWMILDRGPGGWHGGLTDLFGLYQPLAGEH